MADPSLALQGAVVAALKGAAPVAALIGARVYDRVPGDAVYPYVTIGEDQILDDGTSCGDAWEAFVTVHIWSRSVGRPEAKRIAGAVRDALATPLAIPGFATIVGHHDTTRTLSDPDGITTHVVATFRYLIGETS